MAKTSFLDFRGMRPGRSPKLLESNQSVVAINTYLEDGSLAPGYGSLVEETLGKSGTINTLYLLTDGVWLHWTQEVSVARIPIANNENNRVAFTGTGTPRKTDDVTAIDGGTQYPEVSYLLGVPVPSTEYALTGQGIPDDPDPSLHIQWDVAGVPQDPAIGRIGRIYTYTYVSAWGEEGAPATPSDVVYTNDDENGFLTNFPGEPGGDYQPGYSIRIYRSIAGSTVGSEEYLFVDEVSLPRTGYVDSVSDSALGEVLKTTTWSEPPTGLSGITTMANGMMAGFVGNDLYFCEPYEAHAWPEDYRQPLDFDIVGLAGTGNMLFVLTEGYAYVATGNHPNVISLDKKARAPACVSAASIVDMGGGAIYASNEGLAAISAAGVRVISRGIITDRFWRLLNPSTIRGAYYKDRYVGFYAADADIYPPDSGVAEPIPRYGVFYFDIEKSEVIFSSEYGTAGYSDMISADVFYVKDDAGTNKVYRLNGDSETLLEYTWRSGTTVTQIMNIDSAMVDARSYPATFSLYVGGALKYTTPVVSREPFRLPSGYLGRDWSVQIDGSVVVDGVFIATDIDELT